MEDKGKGVVGEGDEEHSFSVLEGGPSNMEVDGSDDNYDDDDDDDGNSDEGGQVDDDDVDDDEGDESEDGDESEAVSGIPTTFERLEYEALAEKKRKAFTESQRFVFHSPFVSLFWYIMFLVAMTITFDFPRLCNSVNKLFKFSLPLVLFNALYIQNPIQVAFSWICWSSTPPCVAQHIYFVLIIFFVNVTVMVQIRDPGMMLLTSGIAPRARRDSWNSTILAADESLGRYVFLGQLLLFHKLTCTITLCLKSVSCSKNFVLLSII